MPHGPEKVMCRNRGFAFQLKASAREVHSVEKILSKK
jgi:hypothetical protein